MTYQEFSAQGGQRREWEWWAENHGQFWAGQSESSAPGLTPGNQAEGFCLCCSFPSPLSQIPVLSTLSFFDFSDKRPWSWNNSNFIERDAKVQRGEMIHPYCSSSFFSELALEGPLGYQPLVPAPTMSLSSSSASQQGTQETWWKFEGDVSQL